METQHAPNFQSTFSSLPSFVLPALLSLCLVCSITPPQPKSFRQGPLPKHKECAASWTPGRTALAVTIKSVPRGNQQLSCAQIKKLLGEEHESADVEVLTLFSSASAGVCSCIAPPVCAPRAEACVWVSACVSLTVCAPSSLIQPPRWLSKLKRKIFLCLSVSLSQKKG